MNADDASVASFTFLQLQVLEHLDAHAAIYLLGHHLLNHYDTRDANTRSKTHDSQSTHTRDRATTARRRNDLTRRNEPTRDSSPKRLRAQRRTRLPGLALGPLGHLVIHRLAAFRLCVRRNRVIRQSRERYKAVVTRWFCAIDRAPA